MTKLEAKQRVIRELREEPVPIHWTDAELGHYYDCGLEELLGETQAITERTTFTAVPNQTHFHLPDQAIQTLTLRDVTQPTDPRPIRLHHWKTVDDLDAYFEKTIAVVPEVGFSFGMAEVVVWPAFASGGALEIIHSTLPVAPLLDSETPLIPVEYHEALPNYILGRALLKDVYSGEQLGRAQKHMNEFASLRNDLGKYAEKRHVNIVRSIYGPVAT